MPSDSAYRARIYPADQKACAEDHIWSSTYRAPLADGTWLEIPITPLPGGEEAIALLMSNQCDFSVTQHLSSLMAREASTFCPDCIAAVPTMGLEYASRVAQHLGQSHYVAMGFSQKFWYDSSMYEEICSSTSASQLKRLYLDPHLLDRIQHKRVVIVDDVINTGSSAVAAVNLLKKLGAHVVGIVVALTEGHAWKSALATPSEEDAVPVKGAGHIPLFARHGQGWKVKVGTV